MRTHRRHATVGAIGATLLLFATACGSESDDSGAEPTAQTAAESTVGDTAAPGTEAPGAATTAPGEAAPAPTEPAAVVPETLQFTAPLVGGGTFDGAAVAGKPTVFWFWAPT